MPLGKEIEFVNPVLLPGALPLRKARCAHIGVPQRGSSGALQRTHGTARSEISGATQGVQCDFRGTRARTPRGSFQGYWGAVRFRSGCVPVARPGLTLTARQESEFFAPSARLSCLLTSARGEPSRTAGPRPENRYAPPAPPTRTFAPFLVPRIISNSS